MSATTLPFLLSLGSNLEPRADRIRRAIDALEQQLGPLVASPCYETSPVGYTDQPDFLNCCVRGSTALSATNLQAVCKGVEEQIGRQRRERWREREIDVDIVLLGPLIIDTPTLQIPHPRMQDRRFVLLPAAAIADAMIDPRTGLTIAALLEGCKDAGTVRMIAP